MFFDFPAEHWEYLWATIPTQGVSATVRHRTVRTESSLLLANAKLIAFKLVLGSAKTSRRIKGENQSPKVGAGVIFRDETEVIVRSYHRAA